MTKKIDKEIAQQILHAGEIYLKETLNSIDALERKGTIFLSVFSSIATACLLFAFKEFVYEKHILSSAMLFLLSIGFYIACYFFIQSIKPSECYLVGNHPKNYIEEAISKDNYTIEEYMICQSSSYQIMIEKNEQQIIKKADILKKGLTTILITVITIFIFLFLEELVVTYYFLLSQQ